MDNVVNEILGNNYTRKVQIQGISKISEEKMRSESNFYLAKNDPYDYYEAFDIQEDIRFEILQYNVKE